MNIPSENQTDNLTDVPAQIFEKFLRALGETDVPPELIGRLRKTLIEDMKFTDRAISEAVLDEGQSQ